MKATLFMLPKDTPIFWKKFCKISPPFSMAIDGYVCDGPRFQPEGPRVNFNHHERVDRLATRATCAQIHLAMRQGLFKTFCDERGEPQVFVYANDCDQDVCVSWYLINNFHKTLGVINPLINRLVTMEDMIDSTAGAYPFPANLPILKELAWIFEPYTQFRLSGGLNKRDGKEFLSIVTDVENRISKHVVGHGGSVPLDTRYEKIGGSNHWVMVSEIGAQARTGIFSDGIDAFVSVQNRPDGRFNYVIGRMSYFIDFNIPGLFSYFNELEGCKEDRWGGSDIIGGSPRNSGSGLDPRVVEEIINQRYSFRFKEILY